MYYQVPHVSTSYMYTCAKPDRRSSIPIRVQAYPEERYGVNHSLPLG